jgi:peroxin-2
MMRAEKLVAMLSYLNHIFFLFDGRYMSLADRACGMLLVTKKEQEGAPLSYEYLSRELLWHGFSEFAVFVLPYLDFRWLWARAMRKFRQTRSLGNREGGGNNDGNTVDGTGSTGVGVGKGTVVACGICKQSPPWSAHAAKCGHTFCYYCVSTACLQNVSAECPQCYETLTIAGLNRASGT